MEESNKDFLNRILNKPVKTGEAEDLPLEIFPKTGIEKLDSSTNQTIRRGLMQLPIMSNLEELTEIMKTNPKLSPWWTRINKASNPAMQADYLISDLFSQRLTEERGGENPLIVLLSELKAKYKDDPGIISNQKAQELFARVPDKWWDVPDNGNT